MATKSISQLDSAVSLALGDLFEIAEPDAQSQTGYASKKISMSQAATYVQEDVSNANLNTTDKTLVGAINEVEGDIPTTLAELTDDSTHRLVTDVEKTQWNNDVKWSENNVLGAKNLIPINTSEKSHTQNNVQFTLNEDGSIKAHITGTGDGGVFDVTTKANENLILPNGTYIFSGCPSGGSNSTYRCRVRVYNITTGTESSYGFDTGSGVTVTVNETEGKGIIEIACLIYSGYNGSDLLFKPMIRPSSIADDTYTPPSQTNRQLSINKMAWNDYTEFGVKNLIPYPWFDASGKSGRGITFEYNNEGYVTLDGTASTTSAPYFRLADSSTNAVANGSYLKIKGNKKYRFKNEKTDDRIFGIMFLRNIDGTAPSNINIFIRFDDGTEVVRTDSINLSDSNVFHSSCEFVVQSSNEFYLEIDIRVSRSSGSYSPSTAKARLIVTAEEVTDLSWMPYAMSNYELTLNKMDVVNIAPIEEGNSASQAYAIGDYMIWKRRFYKVTAAISSGGAITEGTNVTQTTIGAELKAALA